MTTVSRLARKYRVALLVYALGTATLLFAVLNSCLQSLAQDQIHTLGESLVAQLAETVKQPLSSKDIISTQVILDHLAQETPQVGRVAAYDGANRLLAQSQKPGTGTLGLSRFIRPVTVDNAITGYIRVELLSASIIKTYRTPLWLALGLWLLTTTAMAYWLLRHIQKISHRLARLRGQLPGGDDTRHGDELADLEAHLAPLLTGEIVEDHDQEPSDCLLAVNLNNLQRLRAQLNADHFDQVIAALDEHVAHSTHLYGGERLHLLSSQILVRFQGDNRQDLWQRIISCGLALITLSKELEAREGVPLDTKCAIVRGATKRYSSGWRRDMDLEEQVAQLTLLLQVAAPREMFIHANAYDEDCLDFCETTPLPSLDAHQFLSLHETHQEIFDQQLLFLRRQQSG